MAIERDLRALLACVLEDRLVQIHDDRVSARRLRLFGRVGRDPGVRLLQRAVEVDAGHREGLHDGGLVFGRVLHPEHGMEALVGAGGARGGLGRGDGGGPRLHVARVGGRGQGERQADQDDRCASHGIPFGG